MLRTTSCIEAWSHTDDQITAMTLAVHQARAGLDHAAVVLAAAADDRKLAAAAGCTSTTAWIGQITGISIYDASRLVSLARRSSTGLVKTHQLWATGDLTTEKAGIIIRSIHALPDWVGDTERSDAQDILLQYAIVLNATDLQQVCDHILQVIDPDGADEILGKELQKQEKEAYDQTRLHLSNNGNGSTRIRGQIPTTQADMLRTLLEGLAAPRRTHHRNHNTGTQNSTGDANANNATNGAEKVGPHGPAAENQPDHSQRLGRALLELIEHLPTDLIPLIMDGKTHLLDMSPARRLHNRVERIAITHRDEGCSWKGCDRPPSWCEVHHPEPFAHGGPTVNNGALFCFTHHHLLHDNDWTAQLAPDNIIEVIPPTRIDPQQRPLRHARHTKLEPRAA